MKKISIAFLFVLTIVPTSFANPAAVYECTVDQLQAGPNVTVGADCSTQDWVKDYRSIKGTVVKYGTKNAEKISLVKIEFQPSNTNEAHPLQHTANPHFAFYIKKGVEGTITFSREGYDSLTLSTSEFGPYGRYVEMKPSSVPADATAMAASDSPAENKTKTESGNTSSGKGSASTRSSGASTTQTVASTKPESTVKPTPVTNTETITISGTVVDENDNPISYAAVSYYDSTNTPQGVSANADGKYNLTVPSSNTDVTFSILGYESQTKKASELSNNPTVKLNLVSELLDKTVIGDCETIQARRKTYHATTFKLIDGQCVPDKCISNRYKLIGKGTINAKCEDQVGTTCLPNGPHQFAGYNEWRNETLVCKPGCSDNYQPIWRTDHYECEIKEDLTGTKCPDDILGTMAHKELIKKAVASDGGESSNGTITACTIIECISGYHPDMTGESCIQDCKCSETWNKNTEQCEPITNDDCHTEISGATKATLVCENEKSVCKVQSCDTKNGYELKDNKCECTADGFEKAKDGTCTPKMVLTRDQYQNQIKDLADNAQKMHDNENSLINKTIGAAGIGVTGAGGMMLAQSLSETKSDTDAERTMTAYLETFQCDYGDGRPIKGGEINVPLPGGNDMTLLYSEYARLANDLKIRKTALGLRPGIESEIVIDKAETGLYDNVGTGITGGGYASIARALQNPDGADATMWAAQKETTKNTLIAGAVTAGVGAVGSLAANIAVNHNVKNDVDEIKQRYAALKHPFKQMETKVNTPQEKPRTCATVYNARNIDGTYPNCICTDSNSHFNINDGCIPCTGGRTVNTAKDGCECTVGRWDGKQCRENVQKACPLTGLVKSGNCNCIDNAGSDSDNKCECKSGYIEIEGKCEREEPVVQQPEPAIGQFDVIVSIDLSSDMLFESGKDELTPTAKQNLEEFKNSATKTVATLPTETDYCLIIVGKTDHQGFKKPDNKLNNNKSLSERRAMAVKNAIQDAFNPQNIRTYGVADTDCTPAKPSNNPSCRSVNVRMLAGSCEEVIKEASSSPSILTGTKIVNEYDALNYLITP